VRRRCLSRADRARPVFVAAALLALVSSGCGSTGPTTASPNDGRTASVAEPGKGDSAPKPAGAPPPSPTTSPDGATENCESAALALENELVRVVEEVAPSVVLIQTDQGLGSGVVFDDQGNIVTNYHVVGSATSFRVVLADGKAYDGTLVGAFPADDLAVIHIDGGRAVPARFGDSSELEVGDIVLAIGNPLGLQSSVTEGIVSAVARTVTEENGVTLPNVIQTSAAINPGNSGGALVSLAGEVVGVPTLAAVDPQLGGGAAPGIGFAIPSNLVTDIAAQLVEHGKVVDSHRAYLGIRVAATTAGGVLVASVEPGGPADQAGIAQGDVIVAIDGQPTPTPVELSAVLATLAPEQITRVDIVHPDGTQASVEVTLGEYPG